jgi:hypothetical protein
MNNKDEILLEEAYKQVVKEMAYRPSMPYYTRMPSVTKVKNVVKSEEEYNKRREAAGKKVEENLEELKTNSNAIDKAWDIINILNSFEPGQATIRKLAKMAPFDINGKEMSYEEILRLILKYTTNSDNNPDDIQFKVTVDPSTGVATEEKGLTVDQYLTEWDPTLKKRVPIKGRDASHYYLFRTILDALPDVEGQIRSRREKTYEASAAQSLFYFAKQYDVEFNGTIIGNSNPGSGFFANEEGIKLNLFDQNLLDKKGYHGLSQRAFNEFLKRNGDKVKIINEEILPFRTSVFNPEGGVFRDTHAVFSETNRRIPRRQGEPLQAPAPLPWDRYRPNVSGLSLEELKFTVNHYEAEEEFKKLYPEDKYPNLYKLGKLAGKL